MLIKPWLTSDEGHFSKVKVKFLTLNVNNHMIMNQAFTKIAFFAGAWCFTDTFCLIMWFGRVEFTVGNGENLNVFKSLPPHVH